MSEDTTTKQPETPQEMFNAMMMEFMRTSLESAKQAQHHSSASTHDHRPSTISIDTKLPLPKAYSGERDVSTIENFISKMEKLKSVKGWSQEETYTVACTILDGRCDILT
jgi:hypothetical protein